MEQDYNSNNPTKNLDKFLSEEGLEISSKDRSEIVDSVSGSDAQAPLLHGKNIARGTTHHLKTIMGDALRNGLLWLSPLIMAGFLTAIYLQTQKDNVVVSTALYDYYDKLAEKEAAEEVAKITAPPPLPENQHIKSTSIGSILSATDFKKTDSLETSPGDRIVKESLEDEYVNQYHQFKKDCIMFLEKADIDSIESLTIEPWSLTKNHIDAITASEPQNGSEALKISNEWQYLISRSKTINSCINKEEFNNKECSTIKNERLQAWVQYKEHEIINNSATLAINDKTQKTIILTITDLSIKHKSNVCIKKGSIVYLASHGAITYSSGLVFKPEGLEPNTSLPENTAFESVFNQYPVGALLFRLGEKDEWRAYSSALSKFIAQTDGLLEFTINLKTPDTNKLSGNFNVDIMTSTFK